MNMELSPATMKAFAEKKARKQHPLYSTWSALWYGSPSPCVRHTDEYQQYLAKKERILRQIESE